MIRIVMICNDRIEKITRWVKSKERAEQLAFSDILDWDLPITLNIIVEQRESKVEFTICPHCYGNIRHAEKLGFEDDYDFDCTRCGRGWRIDKKAKMWRVLYGSGIQDYSFFEVIDSQRHKKLESYILKLNKKVEV